jgi:GTPase SAR1 family protein
MTRPVRVKDDEWKEKINSEESDTSSDTNNNNIILDNSSYDFKFKICLLGESGVGKTSLIERYINNRFADDIIDDGTDDELNFTKSKSTIGVDCMTTILVMRGHKICVEVWDTAGQGL